MLCPACKAELKMAERQGVEIDYCPDCRGVWLDRGELDKIIERSAVSLTSTQYETEGRYERRHETEKREGRDYDSDEPNRGKHGYGSDKKKKRRGFLDELFDF